MKGCSRPPVTPPFDRSLAMRIRFHALAPAILLAILAGCGSDTTGPTKTTPPLTQTDFYPISLGRSWRYVLFGDESGAPIDTG